MEVKTKKKAWEDQTPKLTPKPIQHSYRHAGLVLVLKPSIATVTTALVHYANNILMTTGPGIIVALSMNIVDEIKVILTKQLMKSSVESQRKVLQKMLRYVELRPFRYALWRTIILDARLPLSITATIVSYVIVIMQLKNFSIHLE
ncbi:hypothetical protein ACJJTC_017007 [Scirpophaga incertulas]